MPLASNGLRAGSPDGCFGSEADDSFVNSALLGEIGGSAPLVGGSCDGAGLLGSIEIEPDLPL